MATATIVRAWQDGAGAHLAVSVVETTGPVEYIGTVDNAAFDALPDATSKRAALIAAVKAVRDGQQTATTLFGAITGTATI